jgi:hypothetical protein
MSQIESANGENGSNFWNTAAQVAAAYVNMWGQPVGIEGIKFTTHEGTQTFGIDGKPIVVPALITEWPLLVNLAKAALAVKEIEEGREALAAQALDEAQFILRQDAQLTQLLYS